MNCTGLSSRNAPGVGRGESRLVAALIEAFNTVVNGGLMPHARQGGKCVAVVAVAGSKLDGTGLENEHIGQIHVALAGLGEGDFCGVLVRGRGDNEFPRRGDWDMPELAVALRDLSVLFFCGFGYRITFGEDFKKPAFDLTQFLASEGLGLGGGVCLGPGIRLDQFP